jgi:hypothetical protein
METPGFSKFQGVYQSVDILQSFAAAEIPVRHSGVAFNPRD